MRLAKPVCDADGRVMAGSGSQLTPSVLRILRRLAIQTVAVEDSEHLAGWETIQPLDDEIALLDKRLGSIDRGSPRAELRAALERRLARRAERLAAEDEPEGARAGRAPIEATAAPRRDGAP
jgi:hypothetical protein